MAHICVYTLLLVIIFDHSLSNDEIVCVIQRNDWIAIEKLTVGWSFDSGLEYNDIVICEALLYTRKELCSCSKINRWSCTLVVNMHQDIFVNFNINVSLKSKTNNNELFNRQLNIDPSQCDKPPPVNNVTALALNSSCVQVTWTYNEDTNCDLGQKYCQITHRRVDETNWTSFQNYSATETACQGTEKICRLTPYTQYQFATQCKFVEESQPSRQFSNIDIIATVRTLQDVPTGAPNTLPSGFYYTKKQSDEDDNRTLEIYWQDVSMELKNGEITQFIVNIYERTPVRKLIKNAVLPGNVYHMNVTLSSDLEYDFEIQAKTVAGISNNRSKLEIPIFRAEDGDTVTDVIPVMKEHALQVYLNINDNKSHERIIVWCLKDYLKHCKSPINWSKAIFNSSYFVLTMPQATQLYHYSIGVVDGNSGIKWARCFYTTVDEITAPRDVQIIPYPADRSLLVQWDNPMCESKPAGPYVAGFVVHICRVLKDNDSLCIGKNMSHLLNGAANSFYVHGLEARSVYRVCLAAIGINNQRSDPTSCIYGQPDVTYTDLGTGSLVGITFGAMLVFALAVFGVVYSYRHICTYLKNCVRSRTRVNMEDIFISRDEIQRLA